MKSSKRTRYTCPIQDCTTICASRTALQIHSDRHAAKRPFKCTFESCEKAFTTPREVTLHERSHTQEKPHKCDFIDCGYTCSTSSSLTVHMRKHTKEKPHCCNFDGCNSKFPTSSNLRRHQKLHTGEKPYTCAWDGCGFSFAQKDYLIRHTRTHTKEKPHKCRFEGCGSVFSERRSLIVHQRTHTKEKPFSCNFDGCDATFSCSGGLLRHKRTHTSTRPYPCTYNNCDAAFGQSFNLKRHIFYHHTQEGNVRLKQAEARILTLLKKHDVHFKEQHAIDFRCIGDDRDGDRCFIDFVIEVKNNGGESTGYIFLEVDEAQHSHYSIDCEIRRMVDVHRTLTLEGNTLPIAFIRYNPDAFRVDGTLTRVLKRNREDHLINTIKSWTFQKPFSVHYMYYDTLHGIPAIFADAAYEKCFKQYFVK